MKIISSTNQIVLSARTLHEPAELQEIADLYTNTVKQNPDATEFTSEFINCNEGSSAAVRYVVYAIRNIKLKGE